MINPNRATNMVNFRATETDNENLNTLAAAFAAAGQHYLNRSDVIRAALAIAVATKTVKAG